MRKMYKEIISDIMPTDNNANVAKTPIFHRFYESGLLVLLSVGIVVDFCKVVKPCR